ncbi:MAG: phage tail sheath subtilisin-like domain-containing protein, partial [Acidobacteriota bacterium]
IARRARLKLRDGDGRPAVRLEALDPGRWGDRLEVTVVPHSTGELVLTRLAAPAAAGAAAVGLETTAGLAAGDAITLVDAGNPFRRETRTLGAPDHVAGTVPVTSPLARGFPAGSPVLGQGFRLEVVLRQTEGADRREVFDALSLDPRHERWIGRVLHGTVGEETPEEDSLRRGELGLSRLLRVEDLRTHKPAPAGRPAEVLRERLHGGRDGAPDLGPEALAWLTGFRNGGRFAPPAGLDRADRGRGGNGLLGLAALEAVEEVGTVAVPDLIVPDLHGLIPAAEVPAEGILFAEPPPAGAERFPTLRDGQRELLAHCGRLGERFAVLDAPRGAAAGAGALPVAEWAAAFRLLPEASYGALYSPWLRQRAADLGGPSFGNGSPWLPPCGHVAGIYARSEIVHGVGKAPANEVLEGVVDLELCIGDDRQAELNPVGVNCLRAMPGRGLRVWGARTLSPEIRWRYVNVRRVALAIVKRILAGLRWTVFEPNGPALWTEIRTALTLLLRGLFQGGALAGTRPEEAFFVQCDAETNPPEVTARGELIARVGFAPALPAEFVVVTIRRTGESLQAREETDRATA